MPPKWLYHFSGITVFKAFFFLIFTDEQSSWLCKNLNEKLNSFLSHTSSAYIIQGASHWIGVLSYRVETEERFLCLFKVQFCHHLNDLIKAPSIGSHPAYILYRHDKWFSLLCVCVQIDDKHNYWPQTIDFEDSSLDLINIEHKTYKLTLALRIDNIM